MNVLYVFHAACQLKLQMLLWYYDSDFAHAILLMTVHDLGIFIDADLSMRSHFAVLWQLRSIRWFVPSSVYQTLVIALLLQLGRSLRCSDHITDTLHGQFSLAACFWTSSNGQSSSTELCTSQHPGSFSEELCCVADMPARGHLRSSTSSLLEPGCPTVMQRYCCWPFVSRSWSQDLEWSFWRCHIRFCES